ncbi:MAG: type IV secretion system DNA-binding domain-containing protein, partial [Anaerolineae bacterium]|nr:type IV secretion system DNA-binding domain-containing protein [Anaerolineae bacterium]
DDAAKLQASGDLWAAVHSTMARSARDTWLGGGLHLSFELVCRAGERLAFYVWLPRPIAQTMVRQLRAAHPGLDVQALRQDSDPASGLDDYLNQVSPSAAWAWLDLGLAREPWRPLRRDFKVDPLPSLLSALEGLSAGNELAAIHFIVRPATGRWAQGATTFIKKQRGDNTPKGQPRPILGSEDRALLKTIEEKSRGKGYDLCLRLAVAGQGDVEGNAERLARTFDLFEADNAFTVRSRGTQEELYRVQGRYLPAGWRPSVVSIAELGVMAHLPNKAVTGIGLDRARAKMLAPSPASFVAPGEQRVVLGRYAEVPAFAPGLTPLPYPWAGLRRRLNLSDPVGTDSQPDPAAETEPQVGIKLQDGRRHFHVIGPTGVGKSTMLLRMIWQYLAHFPETSVWLQEPHQDLTHKVIRRIPLWREKDVIWLDVMDPERVIGINPLEFRPGADLGAVVANVMGVMRKAMGANWDQAVQMQEILENALLAVISGQSEATMVHLFKLLTDPDYRYDLTYNLDDPIGQPYWQALEQKKDRELDAMFSVPRRRINAFLRNSVVRRIVAQPRSTVNFRQALDTGKVILVQLDGRMGAGNRTFVGAMMMYKLFGAVMSRMDIPEAERRQAAICVDEFQTFVGQSGQEFADILEQARKMGASLTLAHQHLGQLGDLTNSVANNTGTKVVFRAEAADAPKFLKWLPELSAVEDLTTLANFRCYVRPMVNGSPQPVCTLHTYADPPIPDPAEELRTARRGEPDPLPTHPGGDALHQVERLRQMASDEARKQWLKSLPEADWVGYLAARRYHDAVRRNQLIEQPEQIPDKLDRVRALVRLGYGTPHYETEALVDTILGY